MNILIPTLAVAFAALCVWLGVRIFNRRERWAKWTLAGAVVLPVLYVVSFGPACWVADRGMIPQELVFQAYRPLSIFLRKFCPFQFSIAIMDYGAWGSTTDLSVSSMILEEWILH